MHFDVSIYTVKWLWLIYYPNKLSADFKYKTLVLFTMSGFQIVFLLWLNLNTLDIIPCFSHNGIGVDLSLEAPA